MNDYICTKTRSDYWMKKLKNLIYLSLSGGMIIYAVPKLEMGHGFTLPTIFSVLWIAMALLIFAAHFHQFIGVDEETQKELVRIKKYKKWKVEQFIVGKTRLLHGKK